MRMKKAHSMSMVLYDLAGAEPDRRFSPYCWRIKFALAHKNLGYDTIAWRFTEKDVIRFSGQGKVPVLCDGDKIIADSWAIAAYLEATYPQQPSLFGGEAGKALTRFINGWADRILIQALAPVLIVDIFNHLDPKDQAYFRQTREKAFAAPLEQIAETRTIRVKGFRELLEPLRYLLRSQNFIAGATPAYADYAVFGAFQWARSVSPFKLLEHDDLIFQWRERLLDACDGLARNAPGYEV
jgi:glutathione S-transferase